MRPRCRTMYPPRGCTVERRTLLCDGPSRDPRNGPSRERDSHCAPDSVANPQARPQDWKCTLVALCLGPVRCRCFTAWSAGAGWVSLAQEQKQWVWVCDCAPALYQVCRRMDCRASLVCAQRLQEHCRRLFCVLSLHKRVTREHFKSPTHYSRSRAPSCDLHCRTQRPTHGGRRPAVAHGCCGENRIKKVEARTRDVNAREAVLG